MNRGNVYSVSSVNQYIKNMFSKEYALSVVFVKGEISNCKYHSSGHIYFSLKDDRSQLTCVMFRGDRGGLDFRMENGQEVVVGGSISVYERDGKYQLYAKKIVPVGDGHLQEQYEKLKKKLEAAGYFDEDRKLPIPKYVKKVGIVTAKTGAAVHDMIQIATRRNPYVQLYLYPEKGRHNPLLGEFLFWMNLAWMLFWRGEAAAQWKTCGHLMRKSWHRRFMNAGRR